MAKQLTFQQLWRKSGAVHRHEWPLSTGAQPVNRPGYQLFARAAFPFDQNIGSGVGHLPDLLQNLLHDGRSAQNSLEPVGAVQLLP